MTTFRDFNLVCTPVWVIFIELFITGRNTPQYLLTFFNGLGRLNHNVQKIRIQQFNKIKSHQQEETRGPTLLHPSCSVSTYKFIEVIKQ